jgi:hypothetical protein
MVSYFIYYLPGILLDLIIFYGKMQQSKEMVLLMIQFLWRIFIMRFKIIDKGFGVIPRVFAPNGLLRIYLISEEVAKMSWFRLPHYPIKKQLYVEIPVSLVSPIDKNTFSMDSGDLVYEIEDSIPTEISGVNIVDWISRYYRFLDYKIDVISC